MPYREFFPWGWRRAGIVPFAARWIRCGLWSLLFIVGQAAALQLYEAGKIPRYQRYQPLSDLLTTRHWLPLVVLLLQAMAVSAASGRWGRLVMAWLRGRAGRLGIVLMTAAFVMSSATVSRDTSRYLTELILASLVQAISLATLLLAAESVPSDGLQRWQSAGDWLRSQIRGLPRVVWLAAVCATLAAAAMSVFVYERHPHLEDDGANIVLARTLASGALWLPPSPVPEGFEIFLMQESGGKRYSVNPPGWPAMLAIGVWAGVPWLVNPLLTGLNILLAYAVIRRIYDASTGTTAALLMALSPWPLFLGMSFMNHTSLLTGALLATLWISRSRETGRVRWAALAGVAVGAASLNRPLDGIVLSCLLGLWSLGVGGRRLKAGCVAAFVAAAVMIGGLVLPYNLLLTGELTRYPLNAHFDRHFGAGVNALGFGANRGVNWAFDPYTGHGPKDVLVNANLNITATNFELFGWSTGSLLPLMVLLFAVRKQQGDWLMLAVIVAVIGAYSFYWFAGGPDFGARYWFLAFPAMLALSVRGLQWIAEGFGESESGRVWLAVGLLSAGAMVSFVPWRCLDKYHHYLRMRPDIPRLAREHNFGRSLVLIQGEEFPDYCSAAVYNPLDLRADAPIYARDRSPEVRRKLLSVYADRPVWLLSGPSLTGAGYRIERGPVAASALMAVE